MSDWIVSPEIDNMAQEVLELSQLSTIARSRLSESGASLTEPEFLALDALVRCSPLTVGELQRSVGVLPAQMSRILRGLERHTGGQPLVECSINPDDRRRVDVTLTDAGRALHQSYRRGRLSFICDFLANLSETELVCFMGIIRRFRERLEKRLEEQKIK